MINICKYSSNDEYIMTNSTVILQESKKSDQSEIYFLCKKELFQILLSNKILQFVPQFYFVRIHA